MPLESLKVLIGMEEKTEYKSGYKSIVHGQVVEEKRSIGWQVLFVMAGYRQPGGSKSSGQVCFVAKTVVQVRIY